MIWTPRLRLTNSTQGSVTSVVGRPVFKTGEGRLTLLWVRLLPLPASPISLPRQRSIISMIHVVDKNYTINYRLVMNTEMIKVFWRPG